MRFKASLKGKKVQVFMGAGWASGVCLDVQEGFVAVKLDAQGRRINVYDPRNVKEKR